MGMWHPRESNQRHAGWRTGDRTTDLKGQLWWVVLEIHRLSIGIYVWHRLPTTRSAVGSDDAAVSSSGNLAFTRYSFTLELLCTSQSFTYPPPNCIAHTIATLLHGHCVMYDPPQLTLCMPYTVQNWYWQNPVKAKVATASEDPWSGARQELKGALQLLSKRYG